MEEAIDNATGVGKQHSSIDILSGIQKVMILVITNNPKSRGDGIRLYLIAIFKKIAKSLNRLKYQDNEIVS